MIVDSRYLMDLGLDKQVKYIKSLDERPNHYVLVSLFPETYPTVPFYHSDSTGQFEKKTPDEIDAMSYDDFCKYSAYERYYDIVGAYEKFTGWKLTYEDYLADKEEMELYEIEQDLLWMEEKERREREEAESLSA